MERLWQDVRYGMRTLGRTPGFTVVAILTLALGIGVNTSMFSVIDATMLGGLPYPDSERLVRVYRTSPQSRSWPHSAPNVLDYQARNAAFEKMSAFAWDSFNLSEPGQAPERLSGLVVDGDFFAVLGMPPALGRVINEDDDAPGKNDVVVLSHGFWTRRYGADPSVVGRVVRFDGRPTTIVGVMPKGTDYPFLFGPIDAWRPLALADVQRQDRSSNWLSAIARLKPTVPLAAAQAEMNVLVAALKEAHAEKDNPDGLRLAKLLLGSMDETGQTVSWMCLGLAGFVLLIACANIANLQIARSARRSREFAVRAALGAGRRRLMRQSLTESLLLGLAGGAAGLVVAWWGNEFLGRSIIIGDRGVEIPLNLTILAYAFTLSLASGIAAGLIPSWVKATSDLGHTLKQGSRGSEDRSQHRLRSFLVVGQVGMALMLLATSALFVRGLQQFTHRGAGWRTEGLLAGYLSLPRMTYPDQAKRRDFVKRLEEELRAQPGVTQAAVANAIPIWPYGGSANMVVEGQAPPPAKQVPLFYFTQVSAGFFDALGIPMVEGATFRSPLPEGGPRIAVINESAARRFWPGESAIGKRLGYNMADPNWREVVGVVGDVGFPASLGAPTTAFQIYVPIEQEPTDWLTAVVRSSEGTDAAALAPAFRQALAAIDADLPVSDLATVPEHIREGLSSFGLAGRVLTGFGILGLLLAALGVYGVIANVVVQRTREFGIRMAVGAQVGDVLWLVLRKGLRLTIVGVAVGLLGSFALARFMAAAIPSLQSNSGAAIVAMAAILVTVALVACWLPARRATLVDPLVALREE